jgi:hypothetical protein
MLFLAAALALTPDAHACSPGPADIAAHTPIDGQQDVPVDAVIHMQIGDGYLFDEVVVDVTADGEPVAGSVDGWTRAVDLTVETGLMTFTPDADLPPGAEISVTIHDLNYSGSDLVFGFDTQSGGSAGPPAAPIIVDLIGVHSDHEGDSWSSCDVEAWRDLDFIIEPGQADDARLSWIEIHRLGVDGADASPLSVIGPIGGAEARSLSTVISFGVDRDLVDECFVAIQIDAAGVASAPSDPLCVIPDGEGLECGTTCSSAPLAASLVPGLLGMLGAALRRRR